MLTSGEYSYLLLKQIQLYVSCSNSGWRAYLYNFYGGIFNDPSVVVTGESYTNFVNLLNEEMDYLARTGLQTAEEVYEDSNFNDSYILLQNAFAAIDIELTLEKNGLFGQPSALVFKLPSGEEKRLNNLDSYYETITFNSRLRVTDDYFEQMRPYYLFDETDAQDLNLLGANAAGRNTRWTYDETTETIEVTGNGSLAADSLWGFLGISKIHTLIIGSGVNRLETGSLVSDIVYVDFHGKNDEIIFDNNFATNGIINIYTDCDAYNNAPWSNLTTVNILPLSEWDG